MADAADFKRRLARIPSGIRRQVMAIVEDQANELAELMRRLAPEDSGALRKSIRVEPQPSKMRVRIKAGGKETTREARSGSGVAFDYALADEFGTESMAARPFFWPAYRLRRRAMRSRIQRNLRQVLRAEAAKVGFSDG